MFLVEREIDEVVRGGASDQRNLVVFAPVRVHPDPSSVDWPSG
jgi:hypothetical protein